MRGNCSGLLPGNSSMVFGTGLLDPGPGPKMGVVSCVSHAAMQLVLANRIGALIGAAAFLGGSGRACASNACFRSWHA